MATVLSHLLLSNICKLLFKRLSVTDPRAVDEVVSLVLDVWLLSLSHCSLQKWSLALWNDSALLGSYPATFAPSRAKFPPASTLKASTSDPKLRPGDIFPSSWELWRYRAAGMLLSEVLKGTSSGNSLLWRMVAKKNCKEDHTKRKKINHKT